MNIVFSELLSVIMSLTEEMFLKLNKNEAWELFKNLQAEKSDTLDEINKNLGDAIKKMGELETKNALLESRMLAVEGELGITKACNRALKEGLINFEKKSIQSNQYDRLENIEIVGIPEDVKPEKLEETVIGIAKAIGVDLKPRDFAACHRMPRGKDTIARFVNRKDVDLLFANCSKLKDNNLSSVLGPDHRSPVYINPNLCPELRNMRWKTKKLKEAALVAFYGTSRRGPYIQRESKGEKHHVFVDSDLLQFLEVGQELDHVLYGEPADE